MAELDRTRLVRLLTASGYNIDPAAIEELQSRADPEAVVQETLACVSDDRIKITVNDIPDAEAKSPMASGGDSSSNPSSSGDSPQERVGDERPLEPITITGDVTGRSTGTGTYNDFVTLFRDRYERLAEILNGRLRHRSIQSLEDSRGGTEIGLIGMVNDLRTTKNGHHLVEIEDTTGVFPILLLNDREYGSPVEELVSDEVIGIEGRLSDDGEIVFADAMYHPDVPRTHTPNTAERPVEAALISDLHVGSKEFLGDAWSSFTDWLHTPEAASIEYLLIAGDMVEGVGVYPDQAEDLTVIDVYEQYEEFSEELKAVPGDLEIVIIPGNHDAVRRPEPQPAFDEEIASILDAHDARLTGNPSLVEVESVKILMYHGTSLDAMIAELPSSAVCYEDPEEAMIRLLRKRHLAPSYGGKIRIAPEEQDYLVIDEIPDVMHVGHTHTFGIGGYRGVRLVNSGCWQAQTDFQRRNNLTPDPGRVPVLSLDTLDFTVRKFA